ncbi:MULTISPECIES: sulfurtransferase complex subunit TusB [unclassified Pantoea]|jgi:tRNA 2-thiouridine synthesizing protein B|uniref:Protein TusB n=1 Tax=Pantoea sp. BJ2 TaxID=3141322 RepID=A0AAU7TUX7_9GAMM|nr:MULTISPECIES: sulfurtransferase complex subunit TusB [unclassified Pantoea]MBD9662126.1 sulfurtransferase complex subunit TusB [Pantoea sp. PNT03]MBY4890932.1 sulfurtransferase complex subunit TusB [Pantoea sp. DY-15]QCP61110.1 sulfurtransferase complex subunit TusB [Pantoea sp. SO10]
MLYTLLQSPWQCDLDSLLLLLQEGDDLLLLQDGVSAALAGSQMLIKLSASPATLWVLEEDVGARGLDEQISTNVARLDYTGFVAMTAKHPQQVAW